MEDVVFKVNDSVTLSGWLVKGGTEKVVVFSRFGTMSSRSGYKPKSHGLITRYKKEIEYLQMAKHLVNTGSGITGKARKVHAHGLPVLSRNIRMSLPRWRS